MSEIATAYVKIEPTFEGVKSKIESEMGSAGESGGSSFGGAFGKVIGGAGGVIGAAGKAVAGAAAVGAAAVGTMGAKLVSATSDVASYGDNIDKMSQKMGLSAEAYQEWDAVMQHSGTSMETMKSSMKTLANAAEKGNDAFEKIGLSEEEIAKMSQQDLFEATIAGLQNVTDDTERTYLAGQLLGRGATELGALLNTSAEDTQAMRDRVRELGGVMSEDAVKAAAAYQDQLQDMQTAFSGLSRGLVSEFMPGITTVMGGLTEIFNGNSEGGIGMITEGISSIMDNLTTVLPELMTIATQILEALGQAIIDNLPALATAAMEIVTQIGSFLLENLPQLIDTAGQIIITLALGIAQALPTLIPTIVDVVLNIVMYLLDNIDLLIDAALQLMIGLATGLINAIPILIEKVPVILTQLFNALITLGKKLIEIGKPWIENMKTGIVNNWNNLVSSFTEKFNNLKQNLLNLVKKFADIGKGIIEGIKEGIKNAWDSFISWLTGLLDSALGAIKKFFGIGSPSKLMRDEVGQWIPAGIAEGIEDGMGILRKATDNMALEMTAGVQGRLTSQAAYSNIDSGTDDSGLYNLLATYLPQIARGGKVDVILEGDAQRMFRVMQRESQRNTQLVGTNSVLAATT